MELPIALLLLSAASINAFNTAPFRLPLLRSPALRSSSLGDADVPDEIAKLIAKGKSIRQNAEKQKAVEPDEQLSVDVNAWTDLDKLPEFKTKVPTPAKPAEDKKPETPKKKKDDEQSVGYDYTMDYADENEFHIPNRIGISTISWGDPNKGFVPNGKLSKTMKKEGKFLPGDAQVAYNTMLAAGISFCVTSETHGKASRAKSLSAEHIIGKCMDDQGDISPILSTTYNRSWKNFFTDGLSSGGVVKALEGSCERMETTSVELYQAQKIISKKKLADGLAEALEKGLCNFVGVVDMNLNDMKAVAKILDNSDFSLTSNQFEFSLTNRKNLAMIGACKKLKVIPLIRNPLGDGGLASGRYTATNPSGGETGGRSKFSFKLLDKLSPLHSVQEVVAERASARVKREQKDLKGRSKNRFPPPEVNAKITTTQVAINYVIAKGGVPLVDVYNTKTVEEIKGCLGWALTADEVDMLDRAAELCGL